MPDTSEEFFVACIITCDSYQSPPFRDYDDTYSQFAGRGIDLVPIIRIFGVTPSGQKTCVHVHGTFPYISIEYEGRAEDAKGYSRQVFASLERALNKGAKNPKQHVHNITLFSAIPFYGYHKEEKQFLRIYFYNTLSLKRSLELLHSGTIMNQSFQPYEAHIPYILQFCMDYNLFGMNMLRLSHAAFRSAPPHGFLTKPYLSASQESSLGCNRTWNIQELGNKYLVDFPRQSACELECDCSTAAILNVLYRNVSANPGLADIWEDERQRHKDQFDVSKITPLSSQDRLSVDITPGEKLLLLSWKEKLRNLIKVGELSQMENNVSKEDLDESDADFIDAMASMLASEESDSILSTQHSKSSFIRQEENYDSDEYDDEKETLEMSQIIYTPPADDSDRLNTDEASQAEYVESKNADSDKSEEEDNADMTEIFSYDLSQEDHEAKDEDSRDEVLVTKEVLVTSVTKEVSNEDKILQLDGGFEDSKSDKVRTRTPLKEYPLRGRKPVQQLSMSPDRESSANHTSKQTEALEAVRSPKDSVPKSRSSAKTKYKDWKPVQQLSMSSSSERNANNTSKETEVVVAVQSSKGFVPKSRSSAKMKYMDWKPVQRLSMSPKSKSSANHTSKQTAVVEAVQSPKISVPKSRFSAKMKYVDSKPVQRWSMSPNSKSSENHPSKRTEVVEAVQSPKISVPKSRFSAKTKYVDWKPALPLSMSSNSKSSENHLSKLTEVIETVQSPKGSVPKSRSSAKTKYVETAEKSRRETRSVSKMFLRNRATKFSLVPDNCYSMHELLTTLPSESFEVIKNNEVYISKSIDLAEIKLIGKERLVLNQQCISDNTPKRGKSYRRRLFSRKKLKNKHKIWIKNKCPEEHVPSSNTIEKVNGGVEDFILETRSLRTRLDRSSGTIHSLHNFERDKKKILSTLLEENSEHKMNTIPSSFLLPSSQEYLREVELRKEGKFLSCPSALVRNESYDEGTGFQSEISVRKLLECSDRNTKDEGVLYNLPIASPDSPVLSNNPSSLLCKSPNAFKNARVGVEDFISETRSLRSRLGRSSGIINSIHDFESDKRKKSSTVLEDNSEHIMNTIPSSLFLPSVKKSFSEVELQKGETLSCPSVFLNNECYDEENCFQSEISPQKLLGCCKNTEDEDVLYKLSFASPESPILSSNPSLLHCTSPTALENFDLPGSSCGTSEDLFTSDTSGSKNCFVKESTAIVDDNSRMEDFLPSSGSLWKDFYGSLNSFTKEDESRKETDIFIERNDDFPEDTNDSTVEDDCLKLSSSSSENSVDLTCSFEHYKPHKPTQSTSKISQNKNELHRCSEESDYIEQLQVSNIENKELDNKLTSHRDQLNTNTPDSFSAVGTPEKSPRLCPAKMSQMENFYDSVILSSGSSNATLTEFRPDSSKCAKEPCHILSFESAPTRDQVQRNLNSKDKHTSLNIFLRNSALTYNVKISELEEFHSQFLSNGSYSKLCANSKAGKKSGSKTSIITTAEEPPSRISVETWCKKKKRKRKMKSDWLLKRGDRKWKKFQSALENAPVCSQYHAGSTTDANEVRCKRLSDMRRQFFGGRMLSDTQQGSNENHNSSTSFSVSSFEYKKMTPKQFDESFSTIEGHRPDDDSFLAVPQAQEKFHTSKTNAQPLSLLCLELHVETRAELKPNPKVDPIQGLFYCLNRFSSHPSLPQREAGAIVVSPGMNSEHFSYMFSHLGLPRLALTEVDNEKLLVEKFIQIILRWDPDIVVGYEIERLSWGYLVERWSVLDPTLCSGLSRIPQLPKTSQNFQQQKPQQNQNAFGSDFDDPGSDFIPDLVLPGRIVLNVWRILRAEIALTSYTFENVYHHILNQRTPKYSHRILTQWFNASKKQRLLVLEYYLQRTVGSVELLEHFNIVGRTSELARIFGIQFYEVFSRGSQFRVESMMLRLVQSRGFLPVSCSVQQRAHARAPECVPLILEPNSQLYTDPVVVLDFQSLYPSIIIAHNYCYSTCLGRLEHLGKSGPYEFGCTLLSVSPDSLKGMEDYVTISPCGVVFVKPEVRTGVLPIMLQEILNTRIMVKQSMKNYKDNQALTKLLDARQLGLKLIANVTYGYTGANFSGRMPCVEVADSIISKSRETLQNAINFVETKWKATVVYGDTDSMFVWLPGRSRDEAFKIGQEIADSVTEMCPKPVKLKFEKVYQPCILQTKKRYVGFMYETPDQTEPVFDAKGIETVRRDSCPAVGKILEKSLRLLFSTLDATVVESYVKHQFRKVFANRRNMQDLIFAKEYRGKARYRPGACVPALEIAKRLSEADPRSEPLCGERVPYVIVYGPPGLPLIKLVREPHELLRDPALKLNTIYYVTRVIAPPLDRVFALMGLNVHHWIQDLPRALTVDNLGDGTNAFCAPGTSSVVSKTSLSQYFSRVGCLACGVLCDGTLCPSCTVKPDTVLVSQTEKQCLAERKANHLLQICQSCSGLPLRMVPCLSLDCPNTFLVVHSQYEVQRTTQNLKHICNVFHLNW